MSHFAHRLAWNRLVQNDSAAAGRSRCYDIVRSLPYTSPHFCDQSPIARDVYYIPNAVQLDSMGAVASD